MANISFIAILIGTAGAAGGIETGNMAGFIAAAVIHICGIVGMAIVDVIFDIHFNFNCTDSFY